MRSYLNRSFYIKKDINEEEKTTYRQRSLHTKLTAIQQPPSIKKQIFTQQTKPEPKFTLSRISNSRFSKTRYLRNERAETSLQTLDDELQIEKKNDSQTIESFFLGQGFDFTSHVSRNNYLPIEKFEDDQLQTISDDQVIKMLKTKKIQIEVMEQSSLGDWFWYKAELISYTKMFHYKRKNKEGRCCRIHFIMEFEDKFLYLKKLQKAFYLRDQMDRYLKFNCYVENMPTDDLVQIKNSQIKSIQKRIGFEFVSSMVNQQINEVNMMYLRTQNSIIFVRFLKCCETNQKFKDLLNIFKDQYTPKQKSLKNLIQVQQIYSEGVLIQTIDTSFSILRQSYILASISMIKQVQKCLQFISNKINELLQLDIFVYQQQPFEKFKFQQEVSIKNILTSIKIKWIQDIIDNCSQNLQIQNKKSLLLNQIQLDRFFQLIRMKLQDALQNFININIDKFLKYLLKHFPEDVQIISYSQVHNIYNYYLTLIKPLFTIQILHRTNEIMFSANPIQFKEFLLSLEQQIYDQLADIPDPETRLIEYYQKDFLYEMNGNLKAPEKNIEFKEKVEFLSEKIKKHLFEYIKLFENILHIEIQKPFEIQKAEMLITNNREDIQQIEQIPQFIEVCGFLVIMEDMRYEFLQILKKREQFYIEQLAQFQKEDCLRLLNEYANLELKILEKPENIEFLVEKREFLEDVVPVKLNNLQQEVQQNKQYFELLNSIIECQTIVHINFYPIRRDDTHKYYRLLLQELYILKQTEMQKIQLEKQKEEIFKAQAVEQQKFKKKIKHLQQQIVSFQQFSQIEDNEKAINIMMQIEKQLQQYQEEAQKFNKREQLFGLPQTNYENILQLQNEFKPFYSIWKVNQIWQDQFSKWFNDPLSLVNCNSLEQFFNVEFKQFTQVYENIQNFEIVELWQSIKKEIDQFQIYVPILLALTKNNLRDRHYKYLSDLLKINQTQITSQSSLNFLIQNNIINYSEESIYLGLQAQEEYGIEQILKQISDIWKEQKIVSISVKGIQIIKKLDIIQNLVDDHLISLEVVMRQKNNTFFLEEIENLYDKLKQVSQFLEEWSQAQNQIVYLQPIFDSNDILKQLPVEFKKFRQIDKLYKETIGFSENVIEFGIQDIQKVQLINTLLDQIQKELGNYLERKKEKFSRFYFVSNEEILEILSNGQDLSFLQKYLFKLFEGIISLKMNKQQEIYALQTKDCELKLSQKININNKNIEDWLVELEQSMKENIKEAILYNNSDIGNQISIINFEVDYTSNVEEYLQSGRDLRIYLMELKDQLLNKNLDISIIILLAHHVDVIQKLVDYNHELIPFFWSLQMRYYITNSQCRIKSLESNIEYGYEFLGNIERIIITPLTERSLILFLNAIHYKKGGAAVGQTGTGKTETIKDLCRAMGQRCIQFNCSELVDYVIISQFIKGLSLSGCWSCFDEFNRITTEVLSVAASNFIQFQPSGIFVTMNPNYRGRNQLPDNLKSYFRMASMIAPNTQIIISTLLYVHGFNEPQILTKKLLEIFKISQDLLSNQPHYDYSLRAIKSVITFAGLLKNESIHSGQDGQNYILKALKYVFEPKLLTEDWQIFNSLVEQSIPLREIRSVNWDNLGNFIATSTLQQKVTELQQIFKFRHGIMVVGPAGQGKSTCLEIVLKQQQLNYVKIFPKSMKVSELYGCLNISSLEWEEGVLPNILKQEQHHYQVLIFDGSIETEWIETLNSVLDDSKRLCLTNGCIININQTLIFETDDLKGATPSTISRCGVLYIEDDPLLGLKSYISQTCQNQASKFNDIVEKLKSKIIEHQIPLTFFSQQMINIMKAIENEYHQVNQQLFIYCLAWSILPQIEDKGKKSIFNQYLLNLGNIFCDNLLIYNEYKEETHRFQLIHVPSVLKFTCYEDIYVPRLEDMSYKKISTQLLNYSSVRFEGISGAGKTKLIYEILHSFHHIRINCSSQTNSSLLQQSLEINLEKRRKGVYGPSMGSKCLIILDDFHMPQDIDILRQFLHQKGWFPKRDPHTVLQKIEDTNLLVAMNTYHNHQDRLLRLWSTFKFTHDEQIYQTIFTQIASAFQMQQVVSKTLQAYKQIKEQIKATPLKIHYQFTIRDVWRVLQSLCNKKTANESQWNFEMSRVFVDRLILKQDKIIAQSILGIESVYFAEFTSGYNDHSYKVVSNFDNLLQLLKEQFQKFEIPIYYDALKSLIAISRVIGLYQGHMVILGHVGTGGVQLAKLAALIQENDCPNIDRWKDDLKNIIKKCIFENKKATIIVDECKNSHNQPQIYQDLSTLLNCGDLDIFTRQELDDMLKVFEDQITSNQVNSGKNFKILLHQKFVNRIQTNLHFIACIYTTNKFRHYPNLINCTTILALQQLSEQALISIAQVNLKQRGFQELSQRHLCELLKYIHQSALSIDNNQQIQTVTSIHYQEFIMSFNRIYEEKSLELEQKICRIKKGLQKILTANETISELKNELLEITPEIEKAQQESSIMMEKLRIEKDQAFQQESLLSEDENQANYQQIQATKLADEAVQAVQEVNLLLEETLQDVSKLKKEHLIEIKSLGKPPKPVIIILTGVVILNLDTLKSQISQSLNTLTIQDYFEIAKKYLLNDPKELLELIRSYDKNNINPYSINKLEKIVLTEPDFTFDRARQCSAAVKYLYSWVKAMYEYNKVYIETKPLREKLLEAQKQLKLKTSILNEKKNQLSIVLKKVKQLQEQFDIQTEKCDQLNKQLDSSTVRLQRAINLTTGLEEEQQRWTLQISSLENSKKCLLGDCVLASAYLSYCSSLSEQLRYQILLKWQIQIKLKTAIEHLPWDFLSNSIIPNNQQNNQIFLEYANKPILCIDPQCLANQFIRNNYQVKIVNDQHSFEQACLLKLNILIENMNAEQKKNTTFSTEVQQNQIQNTIPDWLTDFVQNNQNLKIKIFITTMQYNILLSSLNYSQFYVINFQITQQNAQELMLNHIVNSQNPELYKQQVEIKQIQQNNEQKLKQIEDTILSILNVDNIRDLLNEETLINQLSNSKKIFHEIKQAQFDYSSIQNDIAQAKQQYFDLSKQIAELYFISQDVQTLDYMYQFSLEWFTSQLQLTIQNVRNLNQIFSSFRLRFYTCLSRVLSENHRLVLAFLLAKQTIDYIDNEDWQAFIGYSKLKINDFQIPLNPYFWISSANFNRIQQELNALSMSSAKILKNNFEELREFYLSKIYKEENIPHQERLDQIQKIFLVKAIRPDYLIICIKQFLKKILDFDIDSLQTIPLEVSFNESEQNKVLLYVLQNNQDPMEQIKEFSIAKNFNKKMWTISLGQGQGAKAEKMIKEAAEQGLWIVIQNCHLHQQWLNELDKLIMIESHQDFRLWLTSKSISSFPGRILQRSVKLTYENKDYQKQQMNEIVKFHFGLLNFSQLGLLGFNRNYEFTQHDLIITQEQINNIDIKQKFKNIALGYIVSELHYGGHIIDEQDQIILNRLSCYYLIDNTAPVFNSLAQIYLGEQDSLNFLNQLLFKEFGQIDQENQEVNKTIQFLQSNLPQQIIYENKIVGKLDNYIQQEFQLFNILIQKVESSIQLIQRILSGEQISNISIIEDIKCQRVPQLWIEYGFKTDKNLSQWFQELQKRSSFLSDWNEKGIPSAIWLGGLMKPNSFFMHAKFTENCLNKKTIFTILDSIQLEHITSSPEIGYYIYGIVLQGAKWNEKQHILNESEQMLNEFPICYLNYKNEDEYQLFYECPLYRLLDRQERVAFIPMPCDPIKDWLISGPKENLRRLHPIAQQKREQYSQTPEPLKYKTREESPFRIMRSQNGNLPVYKKFYNRSEIPRTVIRHIEGDLNEFMTELKKVCSNADIIEKVGRVEINGSHTMSVRKWLQQLGF